LLYNELLSFHNGVYQTLYSSEQKDLIFPALRTKYHRITLCSKNNDERVTIDFNLHFEDLRSDISSQKKKRNHLAQTHDIENLVMIESKSMNEHCISHEIMKQFHIPTAKACSKYCLGLYYFEKVKEWSTFQDTINTIEKIKRAKNNTDFYSSQVAIQTVLPNYETQELLLA
jgi:hypothetical protein